MKVYLHLAEGFEEIEALSVVDILRRAEIDIETVSISNNKQVTGGHGIKVLADLIFTEVNYNKGNMIILPGGMPGTINLEQHEGLKSEILRYFELEKWIAAICAAPKVLGNIGLLNGKKATCYPGFEKELSGAEISSDSVVTDGKIITSRGVGTAIAFALEIVKQLKGKDIAEVLKQKLLA